MSIAVIKTGGKQYKVEEGDTLKIEKLSDIESKNLEFPDILNNKKVSATILEEVVKGEKIRVSKFKRKVRYRRTAGHRQKYTLIKIEKIS